MKAGKDFGKLSSIAGRPDRMDVIRQRTSSPLILRLPQRRPATAGPTLRQLESRRRFKEAVQYAKSVLRDPESYEAWRRHLKPTRSVYTAVIARYLKHTT